MGVAEDECNGITGKDQAERAGSHRFSFPADERWWRVFQRASFACGTPRPAVRPGMLIIEIGKP
jgi:hypothetical protein